MAKEKLNPEILLESLREDFRSMGGHFQDFSRQVIEQGISDFPTFIAFARGCSVGKPFMRKEEHGTNWNYNASVVEEFMEKGVIAEEYIEQFKVAHSNPLDKACVLLLLDQGANMIFVPY